MLKVHSLCLPYFHKDAVSFFFLDGKSIEVPFWQFQNITSEGGRFHQFYTFLIGGNENVLKGNKPMAPGSWHSQDSF